MKEIFYSFVDVVISKNFYIPILAILLTIFLIKLSNNIVKKLMNKNADTIEVKRRNTLVSLVQNIIKYLIIIIAVLVILSTWGVNVSTFIAGLGIVGVVAGLAIQDALKDIIMGCNIILDNFYVVGDLVRFENFTGTVIELGLKNTKIESIEGEVLVIANREISKIYNLSQKSDILNIEVSVAYEEKEEKVANCLKRVCKEIDAWSLSIKTTEYLGIEELEDSSVKYLIRAHCKAGKKYEFRRDILGLIKRELERDNIKIPYPQVEVHNGKSI